MALERNEIWAGRVRADIVPSVKLCILVCHFPVDITVKFMIESDNDLLSIGRAQLERHNHDGNQMLELIQSTNAGSPLNDGSNFHPQIRITNLRPITSVNGTVVGNEFGLRRGGYGLELE